MSEAGNMAGNRKNIYIRFFPVSFNYPFQRSQNLRKAHLTRKKIKAELGNDFVEFRACLTSSEGSFYFI